MNIKIRLTIFVAVFIAMLILSQLSPAYSCSVDNFLLTKEGNFAAATPQALNEVLASASDNKTKLAELVKNGTALELKDGVKVQVLERSVELKMLKIKFEGEKKTYWVKDGALAPIDCKK